MQADGGAATSRSLLDSPAYVSIRQHTSAYVGGAATSRCLLGSPAYVSIRQGTSRIYIYYIYVNIYMYQGVRVCGVASCVLVSLMYINIYVHIYL
jgi:hypothetical protein